MEIRFHSHALERIEQRGTNIEEVKFTIVNGEMFPAKFNRQGFRCNFNFNNFWNGRFYNFKQDEVYAVKEENDWLVISTITKFY